MVLEGNEWTHIRILLRNYRVGDMQLTRGHLATADWVGAGAARDEPRMDDILGKLGNIHRSDAERQGGPEDHIRAMG